ncbi:tumor necrosis factor receptor superfamily member 5 isoform X10 [Syngnathoides biaculeatus]|uniref:tumor necrosis factor receptor superfamily member 5 isoform X10 n=1 Tax=Syngnathoides biaculeatus TaxID=300417 RepID=UPI002ADE8062|nr:tumor necrosis factor receptor superfamily member 5 isoform X10 [Syngnathoides biaculeatus]
MVKRCSHGLCNSDDRYPERLVGGVRFVPFPKPKTQYEKCLRWIKLCGRPHHQLNPSNINRNTYVCTKTQRNHLRIQGGKECKMCPPGQFQKSCDQCAPCPPGSYTADWNHEDSCHRCYGDCRPEFNHKVIENCSSTSNLKCACRDGFRCTSVVAYTDNCKNCVTTTTVTAFAAATTSTTTTATTEDEQTRSSPSSGSRSNSAKLCSFPECDAQPGNNLNAVKEPNPGPHPLAVVFPMVVVVTLALSIWLCICRREEETCLKRAAVKFCNKGTMLNWIEELQVTLCFWHLYEFPLQGVPNVAAKGKEPNQHVPVGPCGAVHVHNAGTVIFSWLSQFTGQVGPVTEIKVATKDEDEAEDADLAAPPPRGSKVPLSEEEMSHGGVLLPSQEEGKDWHASKEEAEA